jgi:hypothetical protein
VLNWEGIVIWHTRRRSYRITLEFVDTLAGERRVCGVSVVLFLFRERGLLCGETGSDSIECLS